MKLEIGSPECLLNGIKIISSQPVPERGNKVYISSADHAQVLDPVLRPNHIGGVGDFKTVILDPAPGGEFTLKIANLAKVQLVAKGFKILLTRDEETHDVTPEGRLNLANRVEDSAIFVGISFDSRLVANESYQTAVAMGIVEGLEKYRFAVSRKPQVKSEAAPELE